MPTTSGPRVKVANGNIITPQHKAQLNITPFLSQAANTGHIFKDIKSGSLISIGQLCDDDCVAIFNKFNLKIYKQGKMIIQGLRNQTNGLWHIPLAPKSTAPWTNDPHLMPTSHKTHHAHSAINNIRIKKDLAAYLHACAGSPSVWAFLRAIRRNHFVTWPGLTESLIIKHLPKSMFTSKGHLRMQQKNTQSTRNKQVEIALSMHDSLDLAPAQEPSNTATHTMFLTLKATDTLKQTSYSDQTGKFPAISSRGNQYIMVLYNYDTNAILCEPLKTRRAAEITAGWTTMFKTLKDNGHAPQLHILDNECSEELRQAFIKNNLDFQRVPPHSHRRNAAERAIQTFKNHFIATLASCDPEYPLSEWDRLLPQAQLTLNLLRSSRRHPNLSAYACIFGNFDFNCTPLAPPGTKVLVHETPDQRSSFSPHGVEGWYIGPSKEHYRCYKCYIPQSRSIRDALTVEWFPKTVPIPKVSNEEYLRQTAEDMLTLIQNHKTNDQINTVPTLKYGSNITNAFIQIPHIRSTSRNLRRPSLHTPHRRNHDQCKHNTLFPDRFRQTGLSLRKMRNSEEKDIWDRSLSNELGRLLPNGVGKRRPKSERIKGTGTIFPIRKTQVPADRKVTYANFQCTIRPQKKETHRVRCTAGGDKLDYPHDASSPAVSMLDAKLHINSTISDAKKGARYMGLDIKNFYLGTPMSYYQYFRIHEQDITQEIRDEYPDIIIEADGYAYFEIRQGMYGLKEAGVIAFHQLKKRLAPHGYQPVPFTTGLWKHISRPTTFVLCVDDFGVKYFTRDNADHLINTVKETYEVTINWTGTQFCGLTIDWYYTAKPLPYADISMPNYSKKALDKYNHPAPKLPQHAPHKWNAPVYGSKKPQKAIVEEDLETLDKKETLRIQGISGTFLYYGRGVDSTILPALNEISAEQAKPTKLTTARVNQLMDYLHTHPEAVVRYYASDMILYIETDAAYLVLPKAKSRVAGYYYLSNKTKSEDDNPPPNGAVHVLCKRLPMVVSSATEAEIGGAFMNGKEGAPIRTTLEEMGHPQPPTRITTDNAASKGILTREVHQKLSKAFDMRFYWLRDRIKQKQYSVKWESGRKNKADYFTKHHPPWHHKKMRKMYLQRLNSLTAVDTFKNSNQHARVCYSTNRYRPLARADVTHNYPLAHTNGTDIDTKRSSTSVQTQIKTYY